MKRYYLAYGSNLYTPQMRYRCPSARLMGTAVIENYKLMFKKSKTGSYLTVEPKQVMTCLWGYRNFGFDSKQLLHAIDESKKETMI